MEVGLIVVLDRNIARTNSVK